MDRFYRAGFALMIQGTTSGAGKSTVVAGLCRALARRGVRVAPFKPQNMALNSAVAADGGEIGRAQALQALAARTPALTDMNPVLIKPTSDTRAQVVVNGRPRAELEAGSYLSMKRQLLPEVLGAFRRLQERFEAVIVEGAGSPAEINLRENDIANMGFAEAAGCPVALVADIDRGGVFAHLTGTLDCLGASERARVTGFIINKFRGDRTLLAPGNAWLEERTRKPVLGVLPYLAGLALDEEDALPLPERTTGKLRVALLVYPRVSNHTDVDPLRWHPDVALTLVGPGDAVPAADLLVMPGSKNVRADLAHLVEKGWDRSIRRHLRYGGKVLALCGGMQMLGSAIHDPAGVEGAPGSSAGLGLLELETVLEPEKQLRNVRGVLCLGEAATFEGYEIHMGVSTGPALERLACRVAGRPEGALSADGQILATYVHGLLDHPEACGAVLRWAGLDTATTVNLGALREASLERLADCVEQELDLKTLLPELAARL